MLEKVLNEEEEYQQEGRKQLSTTFVITLEDLVRDEMGIMPCLFSTLEN